MKGDKNLKPPNHHLRSYVERLACPTQLDKCKVWEPGGQELWVPCTHPLPSWNPRQGIPGDFAVGLPYAQTEFLQPPPTQAGPLQKDN